MTSPYVDTIDEYFTEIAGKYVKEPLYKTQRAQIMLKGLETDSFDLASNLGDLFFDANLPTSDHHLYTLSLLSLYSNHIHPSLKSLLEAINRNFSLPILIKNPKSNIIITTMFPCTAFISSLSQSLFTKPNLCTTQKCQRSSALNVCTPVMQDRKTSTPSSKGAKKKKESALTFAKDIKGNFVWVLRSATTEDTPELVSILDSALPASIVGTFVEENTCCTVCEASVKGGKESDSFTSKIMGSVLVDVTKEVKDPTQGFEGGLVKRGELITLAVDSRLPNVEEVREKLVLGSLVKMKKEGVVEVTSLVSEENEERVALLSKCLFKVKATSRGRVTMVCRLSDENPDPKKRMS